MPSSDSQWALLAFSSLFSVINPISAAPLFVALTEGSPARRRSTAVRACLAALAILAVFAAAGGAIFAFFGITVPAFQIAGGLLFALMSFREMQDGDRRADSETAAADPAVVPLGVPIIAGPGAITTVVVLVGQAPDAARRAALGGAIGANILLTLLILLAAPSIVSRIGETGQRIVAKIKA
ncbi:MAG TPA: MarC family protein [Thermoanaerobaculia bacterium]|nr:MarC family protein [Thermoanaerobaculia bacterium]